ncbi:unnamed protein product [Tilletia laevis]|uniref:Uncharacterized protein n=3 Tax=Tilletia TaxID=13289 RepID=A0A8X7MTU7_9BASI|nr:hypothetical protein CF336_g2903 [Tilletia laevis]KAE8197637.1 hypothetical protein CF328_g3796 [Tilletia controversa]KAE8262669.1 hypothetical protein A4X03_0g2279 [Tilletia caries]KAE8206084.1 hypothetical protein CF335_g2077 [Tilletia laevis]KAE8248675.1 hypothetical protein A4X06_0g3577 [Tilletia controversa]
MSLPSSSSSSPAKSVSSSTTALSPSSSWERPAPMPLVGRGGAESFQRQDTIRSQQHRIHDLHDRITEYLDNDVQRLTQAVGARRHMSIMTIQGRTYLRQIKAQLDTVRLLREAVAKAQIDADMEQELCNEACLARDEAHVAREKSEELNRKLRAEIERLKAPQLQLQFTATAGDFEDVLKVEYPWTDDGTTVPLSSTDASPMCGSSLTSKIGTSMRTNLESAVGALLGHMGTHTFVIDTVLALFIEQRCTKPWFLVVFPRTIPSVPSFDEVIRSPTLQSSYRWFKTTGIY